MSRTTLRSVIAPLLPATATGEHPDLAAHLALGLSVANLPAHIAASDPHPGYVLEGADWTDLTDGGATALHSHSGGAVPDPNPQAYAPGSFTVATGKYVILCAPVLTGVQAATVQGTGMMRVI